MSFRIGEAIFDRDPEDRPTFYLAPDGRLMQADQLAAEFGSPLSQEELGALSNDQLISILSQPTTSVVVGTIREFVKLPKSGEIDLVKVVALRPVVDDQPAQTGKYDVVPLTESGTGENDTLFLAEIKGFPLRQEVQYDVIEIDLTEEFKNPEKHRSEKPVRLQHKFSITFEGEKGKQLVTLQITSGVTDGIRKAVNQTTQGGMTEEGLKNFLARKISK